MKAEVTMTFKKTTKHTAVYENAEAGKICSGVYLSLVGFSMAGASLTALPKTIKLTVESVD